MPEWFPLRRVQKAPSARSKSPAPTAEATPASFAPPPYDPKWLSESKRPSSPSPSLNRQPKSTIRSRLAAVLPKPKKETWAMAWIALETSLRLLEQNSAVFPPLKTAVGVVITCIDLFQAATVNRDDYDGLTYELRGTLEVLIPYAPRLSQSGNVARIIQSIEAEASRISTKNERGLSMRVLESFQDKQQVIMCYKKIESLFRQLQIDVTLRTWDNSRKLQEDALLQKLAPVHDAQFNSSFSMTIKRRGCTAKTRTGIQKALRDWATAREGPKVCWMNGMAGTGKSTIAYSFCESLENDRQLGANFYCSRLSTSCNKASSIVPTLAYQLAHYSPAFRAALCNVLDEHPDVGKRAIQWQFGKLIEEPLKVVKAAMQEDVLIVIDALDECLDTTAVGMFLDTVLHLAVDLPIKFFITSRPEPAIQNRILQGSDSRRLHLHDVEKSIVAGDIEEYLKEALASMDPRPSPTQIHQLADRCGALFIYAATVIRYILPDKGPVDSTKRLETVLTPAPTKSTKQYAELNLLYSGILSAALKNQELEQEEEDAMRRVLWTAICAKEPLTIDMIAALLGLSERRVRFSLEPLQSILHLQEPSGVVSALHASFPDYLFDNSRSEEFHCDKTQHSEILANGCFDLMERELRFNICGLESSALFDDQVPNLKERIENAISPALSYASRYWGEHLQEGTNTSTAHSSLVNFLAHRLLFWMEVLNLLKVMAKGSEVLQRASAWLVDSQTDTRRFLDDATSFVSRYTAGACHRSTPHIYISKLPFCRKTSAVYTTYWGRTHGLVDVTGAVMEESAENPPAVWLTDAVVHSVAVSPDGTLIASGLRDKTLRVWDARTGESVAGPFTGHTHWVDNVAFSPDGRRVVSGSHDSTIRVWDVATGQCIVGPFIGHGHGVWCAVFSSDGNHILSCSGDRTIRIWDAQTGQLVAGPFTGHEDHISSVAFSPDGNRIVSGSHDCTIRLWDTRTGQPQVGKLFAGHAGQVFDVAYSLDGSRIVSGSADKTVRVWDVGTGEAAAEPFTGHDHWVNTVAFSPDGTRVVSGSEDTTIRVWDARTGQSIAGPFTGHIGAVSSVLFCPDGARIVSGSSDTTIRIWDARMEESFAGPFIGHEDHVSSVAFSPDGTQIVSGSEDKTIRVWDARTGEIVAGPFIGHESRVWSVAFSPDGTKIASGSDDRTIQIQDVKNTGSVARLFRGHQGGVWSIVFSPDGNHIASGSGDRTVRLWDTRSGQLVAGPFAGHKDRVQSVAFSPDGTRMASGSGDHTIRVWDTRMMECVAGPCTGHEDHVSSIAFSPDGTRIVSGSEDNTIRIWDVKTGESIAGPFTGHEGRIWSVAFSPNGTLIASGSDDRTVRVLDARTGKSVAGPFSGHEGPVYSVGFSPDGTRIVSGSHDKTIRVWDLSISLRALENSIIPDSHSHDGSSSISTFTFTSDGWTFFKGLPFLWVPSDHLSQFPYPRNSFVIGPRGTTTPIDYRNLAIGKTWTECYRMDPVL